MDCSAGYLINYAHRSGTMSTDLLLLVCVLVEVYLVLVKGDVMGIGNLTPVNEYTRGG